ncbi:hypothetical protein PspLS_10495, partial [Pyricularia sp. CBS 133598]
AYSFPVGIRHSKTQVQLAVRAAMKLEKPRRSDEYLSQKGVVDPKQVAADACGRPWSATPAERARS